MDLWGGQMLQQGSPPTPPYPRGLEGGSLRLRRITPCPPPGATRRNRRLTGAPNCGGEGGPGEPEVGQGGRVRGGAAKARSAPDEAKSALKTPKAKEVDSVSPRPESRSFRPLTSGQPPGGLWELKSEAPRGRPREGAGADWPAREEGAGSLATGGRTARKRKGRPHLPVGDASRGARRPLQRREARGARPGPADPVSD